MSTLQAAPVAAPSQPRPADNDSELFDVVNASNQPISRASRAAVHRDGLLHRAAHVLLFRRRGGSAPELLLQRRARRKRVGGALLDLSCAEHVTAGERFLDAAARGVEEELGLRIARERLWEVREPVLRRMRYECGVVDNEFVGLFAAGWREGDGEVRVDEAEVEEAMWVDVAEVVEAIAKGPEGIYTPWFVMEIEISNLIDIAEQACRNG